MTLLKYDSASTIDDEARVISRHEKTLVEYLGYTAGPWRCEIQLCTHKSHPDTIDVHAFQQDLIHATIRAGAGSWIADSGNWWPDDGELDRTGNSKLIAAAPELFEFAKERAENGDAEAKQLIESIVFSKPKMLPRKTVVGSPPPAVASKKRPA